jgi:hypothetical protein
MPDLRSGNGPVAFGNNGSSDWANVWVSILPNYHSMWQVTRYVFASRSVSRHPFDTRHPAPGTMAIVWSGPEQEFFLIG